MARSNFHKLVEQKRSWYKSVEKIFCPILNEDVIFNAKGFYHLRCDGTGTMRTENEQRRRLRFLEFSIFIIKNSLIVSDYQIRVSKGKNVEYWQLRGTIKDLRIVLILRRIGDGAIAFYSTWYD